MSKHDRFRKLGYQDGLVWNFHRKLTRNEAKFQDAYNDGYKEGKFQAYCNKHFPLKMTAAQLEEETRKANEQLRKFRL